MALPNPNQYAAAFVSAVRDLLAEQIAPPAAAPDEPAPLDLNDKACVFIGGRFLPRGSAPDFPHRTVLAKQYSHPHTSLCHKHRIVNDDCLLEFDNYGNILFCGFSGKDTPGYKKQFAVYFMRSTECIAAPIADVLALTLASLMVKAAGLPILQHKVVCGEKCPEPTSPFGYVYCNIPYHYSCFPAGSKARMFADHPDDLSAEQRDGAAALCSFLEEHFQTVLNPFYSALHALQAVVHVAPVAAPAPAPAADANIERIIATLTEQQTWLHEQITELKMSLRSETAPQTGKTKESAQASELPDEPLLKKDLIELLNTVCEINKKFRISHNKRTTYDEFSCDDIIPLISEQIDDLRAAYEDTNERLNKAVTTALDRVEKISDVVDNEKGALNSMLNSLKVSDKPSKTYPDDGCGFDDWAARKRNAAAAAAARNRECMAAVINARKRLTSKSGKPKTSKKYDDDENESKPE